MNLKTFLKLMDGGRVKLTGSLKSEVLEKDEMVYYSDCYGVNLSEYIVDSFMYSGLYSCILIETSKEVK